MTPKRIALIGFEQVTALHLVGSADAFNAAALDDGYGGRIACYEVVTLGLTSEVFHTESGLSFFAQATLENDLEFDTVIVAGGIGIRRPGVAEKISTWLLERSVETRRLGAICTGIYGLAPTGLLDGREVTTHWRVAGDVARRFPLLKVDHKRALVQDGPFYTSAGLSAGLNISFAMIQEDYGPHVAQSVRRELLLHLTNPEWSKVSTSLPSTGTQPIDRFAELVSWIMRNLQEDLSVEVLARRACMCQDHFSKAFKSVMGAPPSTFVENLRLNEAQRRLSKRQRTVKSVATSVGFANTGAFQRAFERRFGKRPSRLLEESAANGAALIST